MGSPIKPFSILLILAAMVVAVVSIILFSDQSEKKRHPADQGSESRESESADIAHALFEQSELKEGPLSGMMGESGTGETAEKVQITADMAGEAVIHGEVVVKKGRDNESPILIATCTHKPPFSVMALDQSKESRATFVSNQTMLEETVRGDQARTDAAGFFSITIPRSGKVYLLPMDDFLYVARPRAFSADSIRPDERLRLMLEVGGLLEGTVVCCRGEPVPNASVTLREKFDPMFIFSGINGLICPFTTTTDENGRFRFAAVPCRGEMIVDAVAPGFSPRLASRVPLEPGEITSTEISLPEAASICGTVLDKESNPVPGKTVVALKVDDLFNQISAGNDKPMERKVFSDEDGVFCFDALAPGSYHVSLNEPGFLKSTIKGVKLAEGDSRKGLKLVLDRGLTLSGRVFGPEGTPASGASVKAVPHFNLAALMDNMREQEAMRAVTADAKGRFSCQGLRDAEYDLEISWEGTPDHSHKGFRPGDDEVVIQLKQGGGICGIVVAASDGEPVQEYTIFLDPTDNKDMLDPYGIKSRIRRKQNDEFGRFEIKHLKQACYTMSIMADGFATRAIKRLPVKEGETVRGLMILLSDEASISGAVFDAKTGEPVEGAGISLKAGIENLVERFKGGGVVTSDEYGRFRFGRLGTGPVRLIISHHDYEPLNLDEFELMEGESVEGCEIFLSRGGVLRGHVFGPDNTPVAGASIMISSPTATTMKSGRTDRDGFYELSGLAPGSYQVTRMAMRFDMSDDFLGSLMSGLDIKAVKIEKDEVKTCDFRIGLDNDSRIVTGLVLDAGEPVKSAMVSVVPIGKGGEKRRTATAGTDSSGRYLIKNMAPGEYTFRIVRTDNMVPGSACETVFKTRVPDSNRFEFDMDLPGGSIKGIAIDRDTLKRLAQVRIQITRAEGTKSDDPISEAVGGRIGEIYTNSQGEFVVRNLRKGTYDLAAGGANLLGIESSGGYARTTMGGIEVLEGQKISGVRIAMEKGGAVEGTVSDRKGRAVAGATVYFQPTGKGKFDTWSDCMSDTQGAYRFTGLAAGSYTAAVKHADHAITLLYDITVKKEKTSSLDFTLLAGASVTVVVRDEKTGVPISGAMLDLEDGSGLCLSGLIGITELMEIIYSNGSAPEGHYPLGRYAPGVYHLKVSCPGRATRRLDVTIAAGESERIVTVEI